MLQTYENFLRLSLTEQLIEIEKYGKPISMYSDPDNMCCLSVMYKYNHFYIEVTYGASDLTEGIVPILVLDEFDEVIERHALNGIRPTEIN